jgi:hypothetical protein
MFKNKQPWPFYTSIAITFSTQMSSQYARSVFTSVERRYADRFIQQFSNLLHVYINNNNITYTSKPCISNTTNTKHTAEWTDKKSSRLGKSSIHRKYQIASDDLTHYFPFQLL